MIVIVSNSIGISNLKTSKYFIKTLGYVATVEKNGKRVLNQKDDFSFRYTSAYKTTIYEQGGIGNIKTYLDYKLSDNIILLYYGTDYTEFQYKIDMDYIKLNGIDQYLGYLIRISEEKLNNNEIKADTTKQQTGDPTKILSNPGNVTYADIQAYIEQKNKNKFKV